MQQIRCFCNKHVILFAASVRKFLRHKNLLITEANDDMLERLQNIPSRYANESNTDEVNYMKQTE